MAAVFALARKDLRILIRTRSGIFFTFVWPILMAVFFGLIFGGSDSGSSRIRIAVADEDGTPASRDFIARLAKGGNLDLDLQSRAEAGNLVRTGKRTAAVIFPRGFGEANERLFYGDPPKVELLIDPSRKAETAMLQGFLLQEAAGNLQRLFNDRTASRNMVNKALNDVRQLPETDAEKAPLNRFLSELDQYVTTRPEPASGSSASSGWQPLAVDTRETRADRPGPRNSFEVTFPQGILWGILGCVMTFGIGIVTERTHGTMIRLQMSPLSRTHLLAGKALACFAGMIVIQVGLFALGWAFFGVRPTSWGLLVLAGLSTGIAFVGIMMLCSTLGKTEQAAAGAGWALMMPLSMLGGAMVPLFVMPGWMAAASNVSPFKWAILAMEGALWRGFSLQEMLLPCGILIAVGLVCFVAGTRTFRIE